MNWKTGFDPEPANWPNGMNRLLSGAGKFKPFLKLPVRSLLPKDLEILLNDVTSLVSSRFGFYHVGIFLVDDNREFAVLRAANSEGGKRMLARQHKLRVGQVGIVGYTTGNGLPRIATDVGSDAVYFNNPDLPLTTFGNGSSADRRWPGDWRPGRSKYSIQCISAKKMLSCLPRWLTRFLSPFSNSRSFEESQKALKEAQTHSPTISPPGMDA